ncbi:PorP/SprF family type IX secretion system membrane protein [Solitalea canadensis]|uniref:Bacteroidetes-specific putative membrane protein n=1 Tax=Solitalea canadensis (strain ATCC 29591 / DSM 3403 / JCM 21819 / LMG 8368 / NBRC 15130 / NCIMB 12057 / USAM 9D) TaxID=929556 RepID=H8KSD9_SOLCM|nr:PorP/SprF family type IX secretion system membrane protein [Solitalea canadensis]AFD08047.1 Bacteroidetes-specific putative membrane protein [Solitalea canadensis DSM 3403]
MKTIYNSTVRITVILLSFTMPAFAQVEMQGSQYLFDKTYVNPAFSGSSGLIAASANFQLKEISQNPGKSYNINAAGNFYLSKIKSGIGVNVMSMVFGNDHYTTAYINYAYHLQVSEKVGLSSGLSLGLQQFQINLADLTTVNPNDPLEKQNIYSSKMNARYGLSATFNNNYYVGVSFDNILSFYTNKQDLENQIPPMFRKISMYIIGGGEIRLNDVNKLESGLLIMKTFKGMNAYDLNVMATLTEGIDAGIGYRYLSEIKNVTTDENGNGQSSFRPMIRFKLNTGKNNQFLKVGYAYNFSIGRETGLNTGAHDISLLFSMGK